MKDVLSYGDQYKKFKIDEGKWYSYENQYVYNDYKIIEGLKLIKEKNYGDLKERVIIRKNDYEKCLK